MRHLITTFCFFIILFQSCKQNKQEQNNLTTEPVPLSEEAHLGNWIGDHPTKKNEQVLLQIAPNNKADLFNFDALSIHSWELFSDKIMLNDIKKNNQISGNLDSSQNLEMTFPINGNKTTCEKTQIDSFSQFNLSGNLNGLEFNDHFFQLSCLTFTSIRSMINDSTIAFNVFQQNGNIIAQNCKTTFATSLEPGKYYIRIFQQRNFADKNKMASYQFENHLFFISKLK